MKMRALVATAALAFGAVAMAPAPATTETAADQGGEELARTVTVAFHSEGDKRADWTSDPFAGLAPDFFAGGTVGDPYECDKFMEGNCEYNLIRIEGFSEAELAGKTTEELKAMSRAGLVEIGITNYSVPVSDLDIILWNSNEDGEKLDEIDRVGELDDDPSEAWSSAFTLKGNDPVKYILLEVVYFAGAGTYDGYASINGA